MTPRSREEIRAATIDDGPQLLDLWALLFDEGDTRDHGPWHAHARAWFARFVTDPSAARFPVIEVNGAIVSTAIGTLELGVPNRLFRIEGVGLTGVPVAG